MRKFPSSADVAGLHDWLIDAGIAGVRVPDLFDGCCRRLLAAGLPIARGYLSFATLHPLLWATGVIWRSGEGGEPVALAHGYQATPAWRSSPFRYMLETNTLRLRRRLVGEGAELDFPVLQEFSEAGLSDWLGLLYRFGWTVEERGLGELGVIVSWATDRPDGWAAEELHILENLSRTLALAFRGSSSRGTVLDLLSAYLGQDAAERVIAGHVRRGSVLRSMAAILHADLSGFTAFAEATPPEEVARRLNGYFDCMGEPIKAAGGEILKFVGDGLFALFLLDRDDEAKKVAVAALGAAREMLARTRQLNLEERDAGHPVLEVDVALHLGEVTYGNVGTADRLDFTVIGPAVNEVTRIEELCSSLGLHLLISDSFARVAPSVRAELRSLGHHRLPGVVGTRELFTSA
ncbi:MAG TPA: adenylate/guanylate cyclase domain-containing protein [Alphaproteobacteria bacterium]|nr:adenylate/guanylate cyclase domain-containing protein [Alphaproteobacteria bacterium]